MAVTARAPWPHPAPVEPPVGVELDVTAYLERIRYREDTSPSFTILAGLHLAHLRAVPFENLDVISRRPISLDPADLFTKIVRQRRGGFCYELNGLFSLLLRALGFHVTLLAATFPRPPGQVAPELDHLALVVSTGSGDGPWLADVGAGRSAPATPLALTPTVAQVDPVTGAGFRLDPEGEGLRLRRRAQEEPRADWTPQYLLAPKPRSLADFAAGVRHQETHPGSPFSKSLICSRLTPAGRVTISGRRLIITSGNTRLERELAGEADVRRALREHFDLAYPRGPA